MVWIICGSIIYLILVVSGVMSIRKGHWVMFIIGFLLPFSWLICADAFAKARLLGNPAPRRAQPPPDKRRRTSARLSCLGRAGAAGHRMVPGNLGHLRGCLDARRPLATSPGREDHS